MPCLWWKFKNQSDVNVIRKTILVWFINRMMLTIDSAKAAHVAVHEMALFLRGERSELIFSSFEWLSHCVCMQAGMCTRGACSGIRELTGGGMAPCLCNLSVWGPRCHQQWQSSVFPSNVFGQNSPDTAQTRVQKKSCGPQLGRVESWGRSLGLSSSCRYHGGGRLVANQGQAKFMCLFHGWQPQRRVFEEWGILDMWW